MEALNFILTPFFQWLLKTTVQASILLCLILLVKIAFRQKLPIRWHYYLWLLLLIRLILPWSPQSRISIYNFMPQSSSRQESAPVTVSVKSHESITSSSEFETETGQAQSAQGETTNTNTEQPESLITSEPATVPTAMGTDIVPSVIAKTTPAITPEFWQILSFLWFTGFLALAGYISVRNIVLWRAIKKERQVTDQQILELLEDCKMQMRIQTVVGVVVTDKIKSPALFGFIRPRLLLPEGLLEELNLDELQYVFLHELAHLRRHDIYLGWIVSLLQVLHWFNPLIWFAFRRMRTDQELACDALALSTMSTDEPPKYGRTLVNLFERFSQVNYVPSIAGILEDRSQLERRIKMITKYNKSSYRWSPLAAILIIILGSVTLPDAISTKASEAPALGPANQPMFTKIHIPNRIRWDAQMSPDGKSIAFVNEKKIWIMPRSSRLGPGYPGAPKLLDTAGIEADWCGFTWSANGKWIAFNGKEVNKGNQCIYLVSADGGEPKKVYENDRDVRVVNYRMSLSPHGEALAFTSVDANELHIYTIPVDGGQPKKLVDARAREPVFSPDGKMIAYVEDKALGRAGGGLWVVPAAGGTPTLVAEAGNASTPVWSPDGTMLAFVDYAEPKQIHIVAVDKDGNPSGQNTIVNCPKGFDEVRRLTGWTPDNEIGALFQSQTEFALYKQPLHGGKATFVTHGGNPTQPRWSPDGKRIFHVNKASGNWQRLAIGYVSADGGDVTTVPIESDVKIRLWGYGTGNRISPDGKTIVFAGQKPQEGPHTMHIWTIPVEGGEPKQLTNAPVEFRDWYPCWSPDGKYIAFVRMNTPKTWAVVGSANIYIVSANGGESRQITSESDRVFCAGPVLWSPDGELLAYFSRDKDDAGVGTIKVISPNGGEPRVVARVERIFANKEMAWSADSKRIAYNARENKIKIVTLDDGSIEEIQPDLKDVDIYHLDWSPDGKTFVFAGYIGGGPELWVMENFLPETTVSKPEPKSMTVKKVWEGLDVDNCGKISPDGKYLSYVDWDTGDLAVYEITTGKKRRLTNKGSWEDSDEFAEYARWSPDGNQILYSWYNKQGNYDLRVIGLDDSKSRILYSSVDFDFVFPGDWSSDGKHVLAWVWRKEKDNGEVILISVRDGAVQKVKELNEHGFDNFMFSPEGDKIIYDDSNGDISMLSLKSGKESTLVKHPANDSVLDWGPDGKYLLFASDRSGTPDIWATKVADGKSIGEPRLIKSGRGFAPPTGLGTTTTGAFYYCYFPRQNDVYVTEIDANTSDVVSPPHEAINRFVGSNATPDYSPDGKYLAYVSRRAPFNNRTHDPVGNVLCIRSLNTGEEREFHPPGLNGFGFPRWSPDSRSVLVINLGDNRANWEMGLYIIDAQTGETRLVMKTQKPQRIHHHAWSIDGKSIFLVRSKMLGTSTDDMRMDIVAREIAGGSETELLSGTWHDVYSISRSPDGRWLAVLGKDKERNLRIMPVTGGEPRIIHSFETPGNRSIYHTWSADGKYIFLPKPMPKSKGGLRWVLWRVPIEDGKPKEMDLETPGFEWLSTHPDGRNLAFSSRPLNYALPAVWVMENFLPEEMATARR